jgi:hypothetical protein
MQQEWYHAVCLHDNGECSEMAVSLHNELFVERSSSAPLETERQMYLYEQRFLLFPVPNVRRYHCALQWRLKREQERWNVTAVSRTDTLSIICLMIADLSCTVDQFESSHIPVLLMIADFSRNLMWECCSTVTRLRTGRPEFESWKEQGHLSSLPLCPGPLWGPPSLLSSVSTVVWTGSCLQGRIKGFVGPRHFSTLSPFGDSRSIV